MLIFRAVPWFFPLDPSLPRQLKLRLSRLGVDVSGIYHGKIGGSWAYLSNFNIWKYMDINVIESPAPSSQDFAPLSSIALGG